MFLRACVGAFVFVLLSAAGASAQQPVILEWEAPVPADVDGYYVYQDGVRISGLIKPTQFSYPVTITAAVHVFSVTAFSHAHGESKLEEASLTFYSDRWLPPVSSSAPPAGAAPRVTPSGGRAVRLGPPDVRVRLIPA